MAFAHPELIRHAMQMDADGFVKRLEALLDQKALDALEAFADPPDAKRARIEQAKQLLASADVAASTLDAVDAEITAKKPAPIEK